MLPKLAVANRALSWAEYGTAGLAIARFRPDVVGLFDIFVFMTDGKPNCDFSLIDPFRIVSRSLNATCDVVYYPSTEVLLGA